MTLYKSSVNRLVILTFFLSCYQSSRVSGFTDPRRPTVYSLLGQRIKGRCYGCYKTLATLGSAYKRSSLISSPYLQYSVTHQQDTNPSDDLQYNNEGDKASNNRNKKDKQIGRQHEKNHNHSIRLKHKKKEEKIKKMFRNAKTLERKGQWRDASLTLRKILEIEPRDSYSHLALARLESRRERRNRNNYHHSVSSKGPIKVQSSAKKKSPARKAFETGISRCPHSIHLWQAWALYEQSLRNYAGATQLFEKALQLDNTNPYVCHAYGLFEQRVNNNHTAAQELWKRSLDCNRSSAALVCSLGESLVSGGKIIEARKLYETQVQNLRNERERTEVYLAAAWLEEKKFNDMNRARELINFALKMNPTNSRALVALARLEGRRWEQSENVHESQAQNRNPGKDNSTQSSVAADEPISSKHAAVKRQLKLACERLERDILSGETVTDDGRLFNVWAKLEVNAGGLKAARDILQKGISLFPYDLTLLQAAGKVEERLGNYTRSRELYSASLHLEPSAPTLVAYAMLEMRSPEDGNKRNFTKVACLFEEALLLDPRHGPAYNAYGNMQLRRNNIDFARQIYKRGIEAKCSDAASVYHGLAQLELSLGNVEIAREILIEGLNEIKFVGMMENKQHFRAAFLAHTLGMLELKSNRVANAKRVFDVAIERYGASSQLLLGAALCQVKLGNEDAARKLFESAVNADKKHAQAWQSWGVMEMRAGNYKTAKTLFECGIQSVPNHGALWQAYATMENQRGNIDAARTLFAAGVTKCKTHVPLYQAWACLEMRQNHYDQAKKLIGEALTRDKTQGSGWLVLAKIEEKLGNNGLVGMILERGLECSPNDAELYCAIAEYEFNRGKIEKAREFLEKGLHVDPLHAPLYHKLAELEAQVFNLEGLSQLNKRAAEVFNNNALIPPPASTQAWSKKIRMGRPYSKLPKGVAALAGNMDRNTVDIDTMTNPDRLIQSMSVFEDAVVGDIFQESSVETGNS